jgi:tRNA-splicing ligase RtcB
MANTYQGKLEQLDAYRWRLPQDKNAGMRTAGIVYASDELMQQMRTDPALQQVANVACLPGIVGNSMAMPDCHYGYGFPIGGVAATRADEGVVSPGGVGYDINCGVRLLRTNLDHDDVRPRLEPLLNQIFRDVPSGVGEKGRVRVSDNELGEVLTRGAQWAIKKGYGRPADADATEENGAMPGARPELLGQKARKRGRPQLGTLGGGNHFLEVQVVDEIYDEAAGRVLGIDHVGQVTVMVHTGSRGFGHQTCGDALEAMQDAVREYSIELPDPQLACAPVASPEGEHYLAVMACAANYAWANRQIITHWIREAFEEQFGRGSEELGLELVYDVAHNIAKIESHTVDGEETTLCVHRKGATRAFGPGRPEVPEAYREIGQPVIVPGDMGTASYLLVGTDEAMRQTWGSTCHGAGRQLSRTKALKLQNSGAVLAKLRAQNILVKSASKRTLAEEAPEAYKDVDAVVATCYEAGISRKVARFRPIAVMKG